MELSLDDVDDSEIEYALRETAAETAEEPPAGDWSGHKISFTIPFTKKSYLPEWRAKLAPYLRNLFDGDAQEKARTGLLSNDPGIQNQCRIFLDDYAFARGRWCANPNCLEPLPPPMGRGRRPKYCGTQCRDADAQRKKRRRDNPNVTERLRDFGVPNRVFPGFRGRRRERPKTFPLSGVDSIVGNDVRSQIHRDVVDGNTTRAAERIKRIVDPDWTSAHQRALDRLGSLPNQRAEVSIRASADVEFDDDGLKNNFRDAPSSR